MRQSRPFHFAVLFIVISIYVIARLWRLADSCLWFDEIFSVHAAEHTWNSLLSFVALDLIHPPLFYLLLKLWITVGGESLLWLRLFPVLFSVVAVAPFLLLCRELKLGSWPCALALFLLATNGCLIKYAQEVRMYSLLMCLALFSTWLCVRFIDRGRGMMWLAAVNLLAVYTHYFGWLVIVGEIAAVVFYRRDRLRKFALWAGVVFAGFLPWVYAVWKAASEGAAVGQNIRWMTRPNLHDAAQFLLDLVEPFYFQLSSIDPASDYRVSAPLLMIAAGAVLAYFVGNHFAMDTETRPGYLIAVLACVPIALVFVASWLLPYSIWGARHLIFVFPLAAIVVAIAATSLRMWQRTAAVTLLVLFTGFAFVNAARAKGHAYSWCNWAPLGVQAASRGAERVYVFEDIVAYHFWYGTRGSGLQVIKVRDMPGINEDAAYFLPRGFHEITTIDSSELRETRFWAAYRARDVDESKQPLKTFLDLGYHVVERIVVPAEGEQTILLQLEKGS